MLAAVPQDLHLNAASEAAEAGEAPPVEPMGWRYVADLRLCRCDKAQACVVHLRRSSEGGIWKPKWLDPERAALLRPVLLETRTAEHKTLHISDKSYLMEL